MKRDFLEGNSNSKKWSFWQHIAVCAIFIFFIGGIGDFKDEYWSICFIILGSAVVIKEVMDFILDKNNDFLITNYQNQQNAESDLSEEENEIFWTLAAKFDNKKD